MEHRIAWRLSKKYKKLTAKVTENLRREPQSLELQDFNFVNSAYTLRTLRLKKPFLDSSKWSAEGGE